MAQSPNDETSNDLVPKSDSRRESMSLDGNIEPATELATTEVEPLVVDGDSDHGQEDGDVEIVDNGYERVNDEDDETFDDLPGVVATSDDADDSDDSDDGATPTVRLQIVSGDIEDGRGDDQWERVPHSANTYYVLHGLRNGTLDEFTRQHIADQLRQPPQSELDESFYAPEKEAKDTDDDDGDEKDADQLWQYSMEKKPSSVPKNTSNFLRDLEMGALTLDHREARFGLSDKFMPCEAKQKYTTNSRVYCCEFSADGQIVSFAEQNRVVHLVDTQTWKEQRHVELRDFGWSIVDTSFSPDKQFVAFSGWSECVTLVNIDDRFGNELPEQFDLHPPPGYHFCQFGIEFDPTSRRLLSCGSRGVLMVYDFERKDKIFNENRAHLDDINTGTWVDSPYIFASGSDDATIKVWDTRDGASGCVGGFVGHFQGLTSLASRGDGNYVLSNSKDQSMKLWDMRRMNTPTDVANAQRALGPSTRHFDYRSEVFVGNNRQLALDRSLVTYRGHVVRNTLIRAGFSPMFTTGCKYVYCGSADYCVYIYDAMTGEQAYRLEKHHRSVVRDVAWHPYEPIICSAGFDDVIMRWGHKWDESVLDDPFIDVGITSTELHAGDRGWW